jgi:hypothetical protein
MNSGRHVGGFQYRNWRRIKPDKNKSFKAVVFSTLAGAVIKDLGREKSLLKSLYHKVIPTKKIEQNKTTQKVIEADYQVLEEEKE